ncbi:ABC transporter permease [Halobacteria archaeon AArc-m2/3/4]|uniref:ABC transporter permease n=1 Tax=Natronoglomus mannanivorans TaxID=2979990 RepID=A0AAP2YWR9_9EURY|nr:ABC transporter permease [Halobacteria archaeon AArc-xg1-1]MCU4971559.1 ABC transporter permease [Halobacteria archaeon AArc-m2/3/4]
MSRETEPTSPESSTASTQARLAIVRRELASLRSEKTIVLAIGIQLFIALFSSFLVVGLVSLYDPGSVDGYEMTVAVTGDDTDELLAAANEQEGLETRTYADRGGAYAAFEDRSVAAVLDASRDAEGRLAVRVTAPDEGIGTTLLIVQLRDTLETVEHDERRANAESGRLESAPLSMPEAAGASPYFGFTYTILIPLLCFLPVFISGSIAVDSLIEERQRATLELLRVAPLSLADIVDAKLVATAALAPIQAAVWLVLLAWNGTPIVHPSALVALVAALAVLVVGLGMAVALTSPDRRQAQLLYSGAIVGALIVASVLPEHPANTVAKFAVGSATATTWLLLAVYCGLGVAAFLALRAGVDRLNPDAL